MTNNFTTLTRQERNIAELILFGCDTRIIAEKLSISEKTVESHRTHINGKLKVSSGLHMALLAVKLEILTKDGVNLPAPRKRVYGKDGSVSRLVGLWSMDDTRMEEEE